MRRTSQRAAVTWGVWFVATAASRAALGQESASDIARRDLIAQAEAAATAGDHAQAVQLAERAVQLRATPTLQYFLAREHLALDHPVESLGYSGACVRGAEADASLHNREAVLQVCRALVGEAGARVGRLTVHVASPAPRGLAVRVRSVELPVTLFDVPYPVVAGVVRVEASAPDRLPFVREITVAAGEVVPVEVRLDPVPAPVVVLPSPARPAPPVPAASRLGPWVVAGSGVVALVLGGVFYGLATDARDARNRACEGGCLPESEAHDGRYEDFLTATNIALGVGAAAVATGAVWWIVQRRRSTSHAALQWGVSPTATGLSVDLSGRF